VQSVDHATAFADHLRRSARGYAPATIEKRTSVARRYLKAIRSPFTASASDVEQWAVGLELGQSATRDAISHVRAFYRWAIRTGLTETDATSAVELPRTRRRLPRPARDVAIAVAVASATPELRAMLALMAGAGLRCCEVAALRWSDVDMIAGTIHVTGKGGRERVLAISPAIRRTLAAIDHPGGVVFGPYSACRVSQLVNVHLRAVGAGCTAHQLRHRFATRSLEQCGRLDLVRDLLGHASIANTEIYAAVVPGLAGEVSRSVDVPGL
jgi:site-specific recombinase XerD